MFHRGLAVVAAACALLLAAFTGSAVAGEWPNERDGFLIGFNVGGGTAGTNIEGYDQDREGGFAGNFRLGWAFQNQVAVGLEGNAWTKESDGDQWTYSVGGVAVTYWPAGQGFYVRAGVGSGSIEYETELLGGNFSVSDTGFGLMGAMGYEFRLTRKFALGPQIDYSYADFDDDDSAITVDSIDFVNFTVGLNWYF